MSEWSPSEHVVDFDSEPGMRGAGGGARVPAEEGATSPAGGAESREPVLPQGADGLAHERTGGIDRASAADRAEPGADWTLSDPSLGVVQHPRLPAGRRKGRRLVRREESSRVAFTPQQRLLILDSWQRSGLPAGDFAPLVGLSKHTLYAWKRQFDEQGPAGLMDRPRGARSGSRLPEVTKRSILLLKQSHPDWGCQRISDMLLRGPALPASASAVARVLHEAGYELEEVTTRPHPDKPRRFERAAPNQLWQTDLFTFVLKRQNRRVYLVAFMDDHSRFVVSYGLHASQSTALVLEVLRSAIGSYGPPQEVLTDNGAQYVTWRGKSGFTKEVEKQGIRQIVAAPRRPQTLGKIERFWGTLWRECLEAAVFLDLADARARIGLFIDWYNFQRCHRGLEGLVPADRFFHAAPTVLALLKERVAANALELARHGAPKKPFYVTGQVGGQTFAVHAAGERVILSRAGQAPQEIDLNPALAVPQLAGEAAADASVREALPEAVCPHAAPRDGLPADEAGIGPAAAAWPESGLASEALGAAREPSAATGQQGGAA
jgi:transposase InsO family protein